MISAGAVVLTTHTVTRTKRASALKRVKPAPISQPTKFCTKAGRPLFGNRDE